jgi:hypothetical protein
VHKGEGIPLLFFRVLRGYRLGCKLRRSSYYCGPRFMLHSPQQMLLLPPWNHGSSSLICCLSSA